MQVGPCIHYNYKHSYKRLELAQLLGQLGVFVTLCAAAVSFRQPACRHACVKIWAWPRRATIAVGRCSAKGT